MDCRENILQISTLHWASLSVHMMREGKHLSRYWHKTHSELVEFLPPHCQSIYVIYT